MVFFIINGDDENSSFTFPFSPCISLPPFLPFQFIPLATVHELWNTTNPLSIFSVKRVNTSTRVGVSHWLNGDADMRDTLMAHFRYRGGGGERGQEGKRGFQLARCALGRTFISCSLFYLSHVILLCSLMHHLSSCQPQHLPVHQAHKLRPHDLRIPAIGILCGEEFPPKFTSWGDRIRERGRRLVEVNIGGDECSGSKPLCTGHRAPDFSLLVFIAFLTHPLFL